LQQVPTMPNKGGGKAGMLLKNRQKLSTKTVRNAVDIHPAFSASL
jgi:hypothetical protein